MAIIEDTPENTVRSDLWHTMTMGELTHQQDLMITKISKMQSLVGMNSSAAMLALYAALQLGLQTLINIMNEKTSKKL